nr:NADH-quinone oxidoreductase subunit A [Angustibacter aerolatus]
MASPWPPTCGRIFSPGGRLPRSVVRRGARVGACSSRRTSWSGSWCSPASRCSSSPRRAPGCCGRTPPPRARLTTYESGVDPVGSGWAQTNVRYYLYAYLYVVFAVDAMYLLPWATVLRLPGFGWRTLAEMGVFLGVLAVGLAHAWRRGLLRWL